MKIWRNQTGSGLHDKRRVNTVDPSVAAHIAIVNAAEVLCDDIGVAL